ncbi:hypothetical protein ACFUJR_32520 [Streptomyces sp. NPDC057271]|uniref:hypothetical protein n=1 Tax=unclassified Streptomyces TaxID=2593676 RepID=UPI003641E3A7
MTAADWVWGGLLAAGAAFEVYALRNGRRGDTLSERTRAWFQVRTRVGRAVFVVVWAAFASWYLVHIIG